MQNIIIDRRTNPRGKSATNRARLLRRFKKQIKRSVEQIANERSITDLNRAGDVHIPTKDLREPTFHNASTGGDKNTVHPGNKEFMAGDKIKRQHSKEGNEHGDGDGEDDFTFTLSRDEFMNVYFRDMELPRLTREILMSTSEMVFHRSGYTPRGAIANLSIPRSRTNALARRIAAKGALRREIEELKKTDGNDEEIALLETRLKNVPWIDEVDLRFRHRAPEPKLINQAVMFCLMDVSASMRQREKGLAKRFFALLYLFLSRKYERVEIIFIRHTSEAEEVDEDEFFYGTKTGGTRVFPALHLMREIANKRFPQSAWDVYGTQASDGDATERDASNCLMFLKENLLPIVRYFAYIEIPNDEHSLGLEEELNTLGLEYRELNDERFAMRLVYTPKQAYLALRELFNKHEYSK